MPAFPDPAHPAVSRYLAEGYDAVPGMSSRFAAAVTARLLAIQNAAGVAGDIAEIGAFEGRYLIALAHALAPGERALGVDLFEWPKPEVHDRFRANVARHGVPEGRVLTLKADSRDLTPERLMAPLGGKPYRLIHVDGEHSRTALLNDLALAKACLADGGLMVLDDMLHPGYPTLMVAVQQFLEANPEIVPLCVIDRETIVGATKFVLCRAPWFKRYEAAMLTAFAEHIWPLGADFEPHWCLVIATDTRLAAIT
jgi:predicted O-methyltransferase YrrM